ncbi:MAG TPA: hypothetical protein VH796_00610 [Nitrososphaeraceae archaeon]|jgi:hypothetical protein
MDDTRPGKGHNEEADKDKIIRGIREVQHALLNTPSGSHNLIIYSDIRVLRMMYPDYIMSLLDNNEIVLVLTYYDHPSTLKQILLNGQNKRANLIDIERYIQNGSLVIVDSLKSHFNSESHHQIINNGDKLNFLSLIRILLNHGIKSSRNGITIFSDMGSFFHRDPFHDHNHSNNSIDILDKIMEYERSIPTRYKELELKKFCVYHQNDYELHFKSTRQKAQLLDWHDRSIMVMDGAKKNDNDI